MLLLKINSDKLSGNVQVVVLITMIALLLAQTRRKLQYMMKRASERTSDGHPQLTLCITERPACIGVSHLTDGLPDKLSSQGQATLMGCLHPFSEIPGRKSLLRVAAR